MKNYDFYSKCSTKDVNVLSELDSFLKTPLKYYNKDTVDLFLIALGNAYNCRTIIYECTSTHLWKTDLSKDSGNYEKTLYFAKTDLNHLDVVVPAEPTETGNDSDDTDVVPEQIETEPDDDVIITKVVESSLDEVEFLGWKSIKIESDESQCEDNSNSDSEISLEKIRTDVLSSFIKNKKRRLESPVRLTSSVKYMSRKCIGRIPALIKPTSSHLISTAIVSLKYQSTPTNVLIQRKMEDIGDH